MITPATVVNSLIGMIDLITSRLEYAAGFAVAIGILLYVFVMARGLNLDDRLHRTITTFMMALVFFLLLILADKGLLDGLFT